MGILILSCDLHIPQLIIAQVSLIPPLVYPGPLLYLSLLHVLRN